jgi:hypothetical protein
VSKTVDDVIRESFQHITSRMSETERTELLACGQRASDHINELIAHKDWDEIRRKWLAFRLLDGQWDGVLYDSKRDAVKHQHNEMLCAYVLINGIGPGGTSPRQMAIYFKFNRDLYRRGFRMPDPDAVHGGYDVAMSASRFDQYKQVMPPREPTEEELEPIKEFLRAQFRQAGIHL